MNCESSDVFCFLDFGKQPNGNTFVEPNEISKEMTFPLRVGVCKNCWQVQLLDQVDPEFLYSDHPYVTGLNAPMVEHFNRFAKDLVEQYDFSNRDGTLDIGCNDGTLLNAFRELGLSTCGVEPSAQLCRTAREMGHTIVNAFWNEETSREYIKCHPRPKLITATGVFYHVPDLHDFLRGVDIALEEGGIFAVQAVSMASLLEGLQFDHFYHEHTCIHSILSLQCLLKPHGLHILKVQTNDVQGGSFVAHIGRVTEHKSVDISVERYLELEKSVGLAEFETYQALGHKVRKIATELKSLLKSLTESGAKAHGLGAPVKSSTLLNFAQIGPDLIPHLEDVNPKKIDLLSPGMHIPVIAETSGDDLPDCYVVFAWNYLDFFVRKKRDFLINGGKFIVFLPEVKVIDASIL